MWVGSCFWMISSSVLVNTNGIDVFIPVDVVRGFRISAKCAR